MKQPEPYVSDLVCVEERRNGIENCKGDVLGNNKAL